MSTFKRNRDNSFHDYFIDSDWNLEKIKNDFGDTPSILTSVLERRSCSVDVVVLLLKQGADINCPNEDGDSPLVVSLRISNDEAVIRVLLEGGAEVNKENSFCKTPLLRYLEREDSSVSIVKALLDFKADVNQKDSHGNSPLTTAIRFAKDDAVIELLVRRGAEVNNLGHYLCAPLSEFLQRRKKCSVDTVKLFLAKGADINYVHKRVGPPLVCAIKSGQDEEVIQILLEKGANANVAVKFGQTPLLICLGNLCVDHKYCSGIVKLLLHYNADVNCFNSGGDSPLMTALENSRDETIIRMLLEAGASVDTLNRLHQKSPLCIAFGNSSNDIVKLLLDAGSSPNACKYHKSPLHCATDSSYDGLREDIMKLLLEANVDVNFVDSEEQSVLCFALQNGAKASDIQLLLDAGAPLNNCLQHSFSLICATGKWPYLHELRKDVVQLLLDNGASVKDDGLEVLQYALRGQYETGAIQLLLDLPGMDAYVVTNKLLLHYAVSNLNCKLDAIELLVNRKAQVQSEGDFGTPLHYASSNEKCDPSIIKLLLNNGAQVNAKNKYGETPLMLSVDRHCHVNILKELLLAGALIGKSQFSRKCGPKCELLRLLTYEWETCGDKNRISGCEMLAKFFLLQNPEFDVENFQWAPAGRNYCIRKLKEFLNECLNELGKMDSLQIGFGHTFRMLVSKQECAEKKYDMNKILVHLMKNKFPVFFDIISARIDRSIMEAELKKLQVYTNKIHPVERVYLNCDVLCKISKYLPNEALLNFILAFYKPVDQNDIKEASKNDSVLGKRKPGASTKLLKHLKSCH